MDIIIIESVKKSRDLYLVELFKKKKVLFRIKSSNLIKQYINSITEYEQNETPTAIRVLIEEKKEIENIRRSIEQVEGIELNRESTRRQLDYYILSGDDINKFIINETNRIVEEKKESFRIKRERYGILNKPLCYTNEYIKNLKYIKPNDIHTHNVLTLDEIIEKEIKANNSNIIKSKR